ncbi:MAG: aquaporin [Planctomycetota bacterium]
MSSLPRACVSEFLGTFALVLFGCLAIALAGSEAGAFGTIGIALAFGLVLLVFVNGCVYVSGAQFNPAVSIALVLIGEQSAIRATAFIATQLVAAASGVGTAVVLAGPDTMATALHGASLGPLTLAGESQNAIKGTIAEFLATFALMFVICTCIVDKRAIRNPGLAVGGVVAACVFVFGPLTGASMNPARSFGPALYGHWDAHWVYWVGPIAGAAAAAFTWKLVWQVSDATNTA